MSIMSEMKKVKCQYKKVRSIKKEYKHDCNEYIKYNYNNPDIKTKNALEAKILRQAHIIEKGMSLSYPRPGFGVEKAKKLLIYISEYVSNGFPISESIAVQNSIGVIKSYIEYHKKKGFVPDEVIRLFNNLDFKISDNRNYGINYTTKSEIDNAVHSEFPEFFSSRHSIRQFADKNIVIEDLEKAVMLAMKAPSACNRQSCKVYFYQDKLKNDRIGELIAGNTGFDNEVKNYLVVTSDISAFYDEFERNQIYVDAGIFTMALTQSLHYYGIASCILQNGEFSDKDRKLRNICGNIPKNEKIVLFLAIGYYKDEFAYAISNRKNLSDILKIEN